MEEITPRQARAELDAWAELSKSVDPLRDHTVARALAAGLTKQEIHRRTGIARTTLDRIIERVWGRVPDPAAEQALADLRRNLELGAKGVR